MKRKINLTFLLTLVLTIFSIVAISCFTIANNNVNKKSSLNVDVQEVVENQEVSEMENIAEEEIFDLINYDLSGINESMPMAQSTRVIDVVLINPSDKIVFTDLLAEEFVKKFNENVNNSFLSVHEYYYIMSRGQVNLWANVRVCQYDEDTNYFASKKTSNAIVEVSIWEKARHLSNARLVSEDYGLIIDAKCSILPCERGTTGDMSWPHAYGTGFMSLPYNKADVPTITHESLHMLGLLDLYTTSAIEVVSSYDIMCDTYNGNVSLSAYYRDWLGWISESDYSDSSDTAIETLSQDGRYTLNVNTSQTGVIAYKFGANNADAFYVEYRKNSNTFENYIYGSGLVVYRINKVACGNLKYDDSGLYSMYVFSNNGAVLSKRNGFIKTGKSIGSVEENSALALKYSNGDRASFVINDIVENEDGTISFTIKSNGTPYQGDKFYSMNEFKSMAVNTLVKVMESIAEIVINPISVGKKIVISFEEYNHSSISARTKEFIDTISQKIANTIAESGGVEAIQNGIDYIVDGITSSSIVKKIESIDAKSTIESIVDRISKFFK